MFVSFTIQWDTIDIYYYYEQLGIIKIVITITQGSQAAEPDANHPLHYLFTWCDPTEYHHSK